MGLLFNSNSLLIYSGAYADDIPIQCSFDTSVTMSVDPNVESIIVEEVSEEDRGSEDRTFSGSNSGYTFSVFADQRKRRDTHGFAPLEVFPDCTDGCEAGFMIYQM